MGSGAPPGPCVCATGATKIGVKALVQLCLSQARSAVGAIGRTCGEGFKPFGTDWHVWPRRVRSVASNATRKGKLAQHRTPVPPCVRSDEAISTDVRSIHASHVACTPLAVSLRN